MEAKLTLKLDKIAINSAKIYAEKNNKSLSKLVEDFFKNLAVESSQKEQYPSLIKKLSGIISEDQLEQISAEDERAGYILGKDR